MKTAIIRSSWMDGYGYRLDTKPYTGGALQTKIKLEELPLSKDKLFSVTSGHNGGIYNGPQFRRNYVDDPEHGVPFMTGSTMQLADISNINLLSKRDAEGSKLAHLKLGTGMTLISCSGTIGKMAYTRPEMDGIWSSQDILKVVADPSKIPPGYLYAFMSSKFGVPLVASGTYGAIIQHLEPEHIEGIDVPRLEPEQEQAIHELVEEAARLRSEASKTILNQQSYLLEKSGFVEPLPNAPSTKSTSISSDTLNSLCSRFDAHFFNPKATSLEVWVKGHEWGYVDLYEIADSFGTPPFKRVYVEGDEHGVGFFGSADIFKADRTPTQFLSRIGTKNIEKYILNEGCIIMACSGSIGGIIGRPQFVSSDLSNMAASNHVLRIRPTNIRPGYLFTYLATKELGYYLVTRTATGDAIPEVWPIYLNHTPVLLAPTDIQNQIADAVEGAFEQRVKATELENRARATLEDILDNA